MAQPSSTTSGRRASYCPRPDSRSPTRTTWASSKLPWGNTAKLIPASPIPSSRCWRVEDTEGYLSLGCQGKIGRSPDDIGGFSLKMGYGLKKRKPNCRRLGEKNVLECCGDGVINVYFQSFGCPGEKYAFRGITRGNRADLRFVMIHDNNTNKTRTNSCPRLAKINTETSFSP